MEPFLLKRQLERCLEREKKLLQLENNELEVIDVFFISQ